jgi:glycosyltransferase involved in cell wall biosynthesis
MKSTRILFFIESVKSRGRERQFVELLSYLQETKLYKMKVVITSDEIHYDKFLELGIPYQIVKRRWTRKDPSVFSKIFKICKNYRPDIIHVWGNMVAIYAIPSSIWFKIPVLNFQIQTAPQRVQKSLMDHRITFRFADVIIGNSAAGLKSFDAPIEKSMVIYNGFSFSRINQLADESKIRRELKVSTKYTVGMIAAYHETKDYRSYIIAATNILKTRRDVTFLGFGGGDRSEYIAMISKEHEKNILLLESQQNIESIMNICDVGVLATYTEGVSNSLVEFMALGKPVIATDGGGTSELVIHDKTGFLLDVEDPISLADYILLLLDDEKLKNRMGKCGKERIINQFGIDAMGNQFEAVHKSLIGQEPG